MAKSKTIVIRGVLDWAKVLGKPRPYTGNPKFDKGPYWSVDVTPDTNSRKTINAAGISDKLKTPKGEKETRTESYLSLKVLATKANGEENDPPKIIDVTGKAWNGGLLGNGTVADVKINVVDYDGTTGVYLQGIRVLDHVEYGGDDFAPLSSDDEYFASAGAADKAARDSAFESAAKQNPDDLDDEVPF